MAIQLADTGAADILTVYLAARTLTIELFATNVTPSDTSIKSSFTVAAGGGYASKTLTAGSWTVADDGGGIQQGTYADQTWTFTGPLTTNTVIYGYEIYNGTTLIWSELISSPFTPANNGDQLVVKPLIKLAHGTPT